MPGDEDVTLGELGRRFDRFEKTIGEALRELGSTFVTAAVYQAEKKIAEELRAAMGREIGELKAAQKTAAAEKVLEHKELHLRIDNLKADLAAKDESLRKEKAQRYFAIGLAILGTILGVAATVTTTSFRIASGG